MSDLKLYEGINHIDDDLIDEANVPARKPRYYTFALSAAAVLLVIGVSGFMFGGNGRYVPNRHISSAPALTESVTTETEPAYQSVTSSYTDTAATSRSTKTTRTTAVSDKSSASRTEPSVTVKTSVTAAASSTAPKVTKAETSQTLYIGTETVQTTVYATIAPQPVTTETQTAERSYDMKKVLSLMSAAVMLTPMTANRVYAEDAGYKDPAQKYGLGSRSYTEEEAYVGPAEQELFDRIEKGLIDIDIDRNGEIDMRDAELLYFYETRRFFIEHPEEADDGMTTEFTRELIVSFDGSSISDEAWEFLENREDIRDKELFGKSRYYSPQLIAHLDSDLLIRYHLTHTLRPEYFKEDYYPEFEGFDLFSSGFEGQVGWCRDMLLNTIREKYFTDLDPIYDLNADGVFDLHDAQDYVEYQFMYKVSRADYNDIVNAETVDMTKYREYPNSADSISETVFRNCVKLEMVNGEYENLYGWDYQQNAGIDGIVRIGFQRMIELFFMRNDFRLIYTTPEYYTNERPNCEGLPLYDRIDFYSFVKQYAGSRGYTTTKLGFNENTFNSFYEEWSAAVADGTAAMPDINGNGVIDKDDYRYLEQYEKEIWAKTPADETKLTDEIRTYLDEEFDLNDNGISGDLYDVMSAMAYIRINYPECWEHKTDVANTSVPEQFMPKGDANCDEKVTLADAVAILQFIANRDKYDLKEQGRKNADVNGDGTVTAADALEIQKMDSRSEQA